MFLEDPGIDPGTSHMLSDRCTIRGNPLFIFNVSYLYIHLSRLVCYQNKIETRMFLEDPRIDPGTSHMQSELSTN